MFMHNFCSCYIKTNLTLYMYLFIEIYPNVYIIYTCIPFIYVDMHLKTIHAVCLVFIFYEVHTTSTAYEKDSYLY